MTTRRTIPALPQTQALSSTTFQPPPLDGAYTLPEMFDWHLEHSPLHRLFIFAQDDGNLRTINWAEAVRAMYIGAGIVHARVSNSVVGSAPVIGILAPSDAIPYFTMIVSIMRANGVAFPMSPRNSPEAIAHLIDKVGVNHIFVGREQSMQDLAKEAINILKTRYRTLSAPTTSPMPIFEDLYLPSSENKSAPTPLPYVFRGSDAPSLILHSSGSTAFPKPMTSTNYLVFQTTLNPWFGERDLTDKSFSIHAIPMFHGLGISHLCWTASTGIVLSTFAPKSPAPVPAPDPIFMAAKATDCDYVVCVPAIVEAWAQKPDHVDWVATRSGVLFGGGPLNKEIGDRMTSQGVSFFILYGSTEAGIMSPILPAEAGYDWDYFKFPGLLQPHMIPCGNEEYELVVKVHEYYRPGLTNIKVDGVDGYATSDLLKAHPSKSGYWKVIGRTDDQIMHSTGEKTNPGPLESMLNQDPHVSASVMFGRGRFQAGILVDPKPPYKFDPTDETKLAQYRNMIWATVERMNAYAPQHSRVFKEMILTTQDSKPVTYTPKGTVRRQALIDQYSAEIDALYDRIEESTQSSIPPPSQWDAVTTVDFVRSVAKKVLVRNVEDDDDIFAHGCDSLQATYIRNALLRALRDSAQLNTRNISSGFVYEHPSIRKLASLLLKLATGVSVGEGRSAGDQADMMEAMAAKYLEDIPTRGLPRSAPGSGRIVLATGTTGSLGSFVLSRLVDDPSVARIYALNRPSSDKSTLRSRQEASLLSRGISATVLQSSRVVLLEADLVVAGFGLPEDVYSEMHASVTHIIHIAWRVDFNLVLQSFEPNIKGLRNLVDFSLSSPLSNPPQLVFTSSIGIFRHYNGVHLGELLVPPSAAVGTGYTESKWVAEKVLIEVARTTGLKVLVVRVGQVCGAPDGAWNANEWFPAMVQSVHKLGCFPDDPRLVSWVPISTAAGALVELLRADSKQNIVHLVHPHPVSWSSLASVVAHELGGRLVPFGEWASLLNRTIGAHESGNNSNDEEHEIELLREVRALLFLPWFQELSATSQDPQAHALNFAPLSVSNALDLCPGLTETVPLTGHDVKKWIAYWRKVGLFE